MGYDGINISLGALIEWLKDLPQDMVVRDGFHNPHSYRGYYEDLAFEPKENVTVAEMLASAESALGETFKGYKGGDFKMTASTDCWLAEYGSCGAPMCSPESDTPPYFLPAKP